MGIEFIISNNTIVLGQRKEQSNTHLELESGAQKKGSGRVRGVGAFQRERGGDEKTPISKIGLEGGGPQQFKLQKCIKWCIVRIKARWWSDCAFLPRLAEWTPAGLEVPDISLAGPAEPRWPPPSGSTCPASAPSLSPCRRGRGRAAAGGVPAWGRRPSAVPACSQAPEGRSVGLGEGAPAPNTPRHGLGRRAGQQSPVGVGAPGAHPGLPSAPVSSGEGK